MRSSPKRQLKAQLPVNLDTLIKAKRAAGFLIERRLADARAHALGGSTADAIDRLDELDGALRSRLADARASFHREAWIEHSEGHLADVDPKAEAAARGTAIGGRDQARDLGDTIEEAKADLRSVMITGGEADRLRHWESRTARRSSSRCQAP